MSDEIVKTKDEDSTPGENNKKIYMGNIPVQMRDDEVKEWIENFAPIKAYNLVKDPSRAGYSKG